MKINRFFFSALIIFCSLRTIAQVPQLIHFQAIARDGNGNLIIKGEISIRLTIIDSILSKPVYQETQSPISTDTFGYFDIKIHDTTNANWLYNGKYGTFTSVPWVTGHKWLLIEYLAPSTAKYVTIGEIELVSYPYSIVAQTAINVQGVNLANAKDGDILKYNAATKTWGPVSGAYSAGNGIQISNDSIINTLPNKSYNAGAGIKISNDSIINSSPNIPVSITGSGNAMVTGKYPNFTVSTPAYVAGSNIKISNDTISTGIDFDTTKAITSADNATAGGTYYDASMSVTVPSTGFYYVIGTATVDDQEGSNSTSESVYIYDVTTSSNIYTVGSGYLSTNPYSYVNPISYNVQKILYLTKGDKLVFSYYVPSSNDFYYNMPGNYLWVFKLK